MWSLPLLLQLLLLLAAVRANSSECDTQHEMDCLANSIAKEILWNTNQTGNIALLYSKKSKYLALAMDEQTLQSAEADASTIQRVLTQSNKKNVEIFVVRPEPEAGYMSPALQLLSLRNSFSEFNLARDESDILFGFSTHCPLPDGDLEYELSPEIESESTYIGSRMQAKKLTVTYDKLKEIKSDQLENSTEFELEEFSEGDSAEIQHEKMQEHVALIEFGVAIAKHGFVHPSEEQFSPGWLGHGKLRLSRSGISKSFDKFGETLRCQTAWPPFLARNVVSGIIRGDATSLTLACAPSPPGQLTKLEMTSQAGQMSSELKLRGAMAGPLGIDLDPGLSAWAVASAGGHSTTTSVQQSEAIAHILGAARQLNELLKSRPLARAPFPSANASIEKNVRDKPLVLRMPLSIPLDLGRDTEALMGRALQALLGPDAVVPVMGRVVPSKPFQLTGNCYMYKENCKHGLFTNRGDCRNWQQVATNCLGHGDVCSDGVTRCEYYSRKTNSGFINDRYDEYACWCYGALTTIFSDPYADSLVDLRQRQSVWVERVNYDHNTLCLPSGTFSRGNRVTRPSSEFAFLCQNAMTILQRSQGTAEGSGFLVFDLGDGVDTAYGGHSTEFGIGNLFRVGDGQKLFVGGAGLDVFQIVGPCQDLKGVLDGGDGTNVLVVDSNCTTVSPLVIDFSNQTQMLSAALEGENNSSNVSVQLQNIHTVYGRPALGDIIYAGCDTMYVNGRGGSPIPGENDILFVGHGDIDASCNYSYSLTIQAGAHSSTFLNFHLGHVTVLVPKGASNVEMSHESDYSVKATTYRVNESCHDLINASVVQRDSVALMYFESGLHLQITVSADKSEFPVVALENPADKNDFCFLEIGEKNGTLVLTAIHRLDLVENGTTYERAGAKGVSNLFDLINGSWTVVGGSMSDTFLIVDKEFTGKIDGGASVNTLQFGGFDSEIVKINLDEDRLRIAPGTSDIDIKNIQRVEGRAGATEHIVCSCTTLRVDGHGGTAENPDIVTVPATAHHACLTGSTSTTIVVVRNHTLVHNWATEGSFTYLILDDGDFDISTRSSGSAKHFYHFGFSLGQIATVDFESVSNTLQLQLISGKCFKLPMNQLTTEGDRILFANPGIQFQPPASQNYTAEFRVLTTGEIVLSITAKGPLGELPRISGVQFEFLVDAPADFELSSLVGSDGDDCFWISGVKSLGTIDGGGGYENELNLMDTWYSDNSDPLLVDLFRGSLTMAGASYQQEPLIKHLRGIQVFTGRTHGREIVIPACDTNFIAQAEEIWFTDMNCTDENYNLTILIDNNTEITFNADASQDLCIEAEMDAVYSPGATFIYKFTLLRSFSINVDFWSRIRESRHIFQLSFSFAQLQTIWYDAHDSELRYSIENSTYSHEVDRYIELGQQFFGQPEFMTSDGFQIRVARDGSLFFIATNLQGSGAGADIRTLVNDFSELAGKLNVTIMAQTPTDFVYIGYSSLENGPPNLLTNFKGRTSHLAGGGGHGSVITTMYSILSLDKDVHIYPILATDDDEERQLVDLSGVVRKIRATGDINRKYVPRVTQVGQDDLMISMDGFEANFRGRVILVKTVKSQASARMRFLLDAVVLKLEMNELWDGTRAEWILKPVPIELSGGHVLVLTADDLEKRQEILVESTAALESVRRGTEFILTSMATELDMGQVSSLVWLDFYVSQESDRNDPLLYQDVAIIVGENTTLWANFTNRHLLPKDEVQIEWEDLLETTEERLLESESHIPRKFRIAFWKRAWQNHQILIWATATGLATILLILVVMLATIATRRCCRGRKFETKSASDQSVAVAAVEVEGEQLELTSLNSIRENSVYVNNEEENIYFEITENNTFAL